MTQQPMNNYDFLNYSQNLEAGTMECKHESN